MATTIRAYAQALYEAAEDKKKPAIKELVDNFLRVLKEKNQLSKVEAIISELGLIDDRTHQRLQVEVTSAFTLEEKTLHTLEKFLQKKTGAMEIVWNKNIDKTILGGVLLKFEDTVIDISLSQAIETLTEDIKK
jgi:F-type H+-transporting ATPase subunit delta